jgi:hypothetical protein
MAKLLYVMNASLDGSIADEDGKFDWGAPGEEYYSFINDLERAASRGVVEMRASS